MAGINDIEVMVIAVLFYAGLLFLRERLEQRGTNAKDR